MNDAYTGSYCVAPTHTDGCIVTMSTVGVPSATDLNPFEIVGSGMIANRFGLLFYGFSPTNVPFAPGRRCVGTPLRRTPVISSGGSGTCGGEFRFDFNARIQSGVDAMLVPGAVVYGQYWFRDGAAPTGTGLSEAIQFTVGP